MNRPGRNAAAVIGLTTVGLLVLAAVLAPVISPYDPSKLSLGKPSDVLARPSRRHPMGTDNFGRDILSRVIWGCRVSLFVGFVAASISGLVGTSVGLTAGYYGGMVDDLLMRVTEFFMMIPSFFLILVIISFVGGSIWNVVIVIGLTSWASTARLMRAQVLTVRERPFVEAARAAGAGDARILLRHILPNSLRPVVVNASLQVGSTILIEAGLSFLGLGDPSRVSWGQMLNAAQPYLRSAWWTAVFPGVSISVAVLGFNLCGDAVNDMLDPRSRRG